jgi:excisionase family DNA binding protein
MSTPIEMPRLLTSAEVAEVFRVDPKTVSRWAHSGRLAAIKTPGGRPRYDQDHVYALLNGQRP